MSDRTTWTADGRPLLDGDGQGEALVLDQPLSMWGGVDPHTGTIVDRHHPQAGLSIAARALVMESGRGSSSSSSVLAELIRAGHGPALIVLGEADQIIVVGALVAQVLYGVTVPVLVLGDVERARIRSGDPVRLRSGGRLEIRR